MRAATPEAYQLLHNGVLTLSQMESNGIRVDTKKLKDNIESVNGIIGDLTNDLRKSEVYHLWKRRFGEKTNLDSHEQLGKILFSPENEGGLGYDCPERTKTFKPKTSEAVITKVAGDVPFAKQWLRRAKFAKLKSSFLNGVLREVEGDDRLRVMYSLHTARTYRSACECVNFQNFPIRDPEIGKYIRECFIARDGCFLAESDFAGIEVRVAACYNHDPRLIQYIEDKTKDMHRDMAMQCYLLSKEQVNKKTRYCGKNMFVFPQFYGSYYLDCAKAMWSAIAEHNLVIEGTGESLKDHLKSKGIRKLGKCDPDQDPRPGTFEHHLKEVEQDFWGNRFKVYTQWKKSWYQKYLKVGGAHTLTGFWLEGVFRRNEIINYPIQGSAFHCLLWSLIRIQKILNKRKMRTLLVGQIHDSIVADVHRKERDDYFEIVHQVITHDLPSAWPWIIVPMEIEIEAAPIGGSWYDKKPVSFN